MLRLLLVFFFAVLTYYVLWILFRLFRFWSRWRQMASRMQEPQADELVRDPACEVYIPKASALRKRIKGQTLYFCSPECARAYKRGGPKGGKGKTQARGEG